MNTHTNFLKKLKTANIRVKPLQEYQGYSTKIKFKCLEHSHVFTRTPGLMLKRPRCPVCSRAKAPEATAVTRNELRLKAVLGWCKANNAELDVSTFKSGSEPARFTCLVDGHVWEAMPKTVMRAKYGCKVCSQKASGTEQFQATWVDTLTQLKTRKVACKSTPTNALDVVRYRCPKHACWIENTVVTLRNRLKNSKALTPGCVKCAQHLFNESAYKRLPFERKAGDIIYLMGYEPLAVDWLATKGIPVSKLVVSTDKAFTVIEYQGPKTKQKYIPDFYIKGTNICVEVKSMYTAGLAQNMSGEQTSMGVSQNAMFASLLCKRQAAIDHGFDFRLIVFSYFGKVWFPKTWYTMSRDELKTRVLNSKKNVSIF
jgi:hypothetical protein